MRMTFGIFASLLLLSCGRTNPPVLAPPTIATTQPRAHLVIHVADLNTHNGQLLFCIFKSAQGFPGDSKFAVESQVKPVTADNQFTLDLPPGKYAAAVVHDENANGKLDTNFLGIPKEGYGVSNNPKPRRRGVTYPESEFTLPTAGASISISMQYDFF